ncbi:hypothetical protein AMC83_PE00301 (plasmid) [Rhizobium phaseoli]|nr:hypothetical protein AMC83_PE00301 [Rhizobium phaseoli]
MRRKLVAVAALAPVVAMLSYNEYAMRQQRTEEVREQASQAARQASSEVERVVEGLRSLLIAVTSMPSIRHADAAACNEALTSPAAKVPNIRTIFVLAPNGKPICGSVLLMYCRRWKCRHGRHPADRLIKRRKTRITIGTAVVGP